jgi:hypothetical protein
MTLNLLLNVQEGMVLCADSMVTLTSYSQNQSTTTTFEHAQKVVALGRDLAAAAMISGDASIGDRLVSEVLKDASRALDAASGPPVAKDIVDAVIAAVNSEYEDYVKRYKANAAAFYSEPGRLAQINLQRKAQGLPDLAIVNPDDVCVTGVPGHSPAAPVVTIPAPSDFTVVVASYLKAPEATSLNWPGPTIIGVVPDEVMRWWGSAATSLSRLIRGFDLGLLYQNSADADTKTVLDFARNNAETYSMPTPVGVLPLQDAVHFAEYLGQVACGYDKFSSGQAGVGGELDVVVLTRGNREWIRQKRIRSGIHSRYTD